MRRFSLLFAGAGAYILMLAACQRTAATATLPPADTVAPTATVAAATATPAPAATATPEMPTATPTLDLSATPPTTATPDPNLGVGEVIYEDALDGSSGWGWGHEDDLVTFSIAGGRLNAVIKQANQAWRYSVGPDTAVGGDQQVRVTTIANLCYQLDEYGLMFRGSLDERNDFSGYVFKLNCGGAARVEMLQRNAPTVLVDWTSSPAIVSSAPAENVLLVWMAGDQFHFYVNDKYLFSAQDKTYSAGLYGLYVRDRTNGGASVSYDDLAARAVTLP